VKKTAKIIGKADSPFEIPVKRLALPGIAIKDDCPHCGKECVRDMADFYMEYPKANSREGIPMYCAEENGGCEREWLVYVKLRIGLELG
jgi:hypothetical protein